MTTIHDVRGFALNTPMPPGGYEPLEKGYDNYVSKLMSHAPDEDGFFEYNQEMAHLLATASAWAYSDRQTLSMRLTQLGFKLGNCHQITVSNDAMLVVANAFFIQSACGRLGILCFRGTEPRNPINWLTDANVTVRNLGQAGRVHGGFHANATALWRDVVEHLRGAVDGEGSADNSAMPYDGDRRVPGAKRLEALYITGHSLGGAMAILTTAMLFEDPECRSIRATLRGVYTFGQPMVGDPEFAEVCEKRFGRLVFRHVYENDIVPRLPPRTTGKFKHFGHALRAMSGSWVHQPTTQVHQARTAVVSGLIGVIACVMQQLTLTRKIDLPFSWGSHSPAHYVDTSNPRRAASKLD